MLSTLKERLLKNYVHLHDKYVGESASDRLKRIEKQIIVDMCKLHDEDTICTVLYSPESIRFTLKCLLIAKKHERTVYTSKLNFIFSSDRKVYIRLIKLYLECLTDNELLALVNKY